MNSTGPAQPLPMPLPILDQGIGISHYATIGAILFVWFVFVAPSRELYRNIPVALGSNKTLMGAKFEFVGKARDIIASGLKKFSHPFQVMTPIGPQVILPHAYIEEMKNHPHLSSAEALTDQMLGHLDGFHIFKEFNPYNSIMQLAIRKKLSPSVAGVTGDLSEETKATLMDYMGQPKEFKSMSMEDTARQIVSRLSSRVFLGKELSRNPEWQEIISSQPPAVNSALVALSYWPSLMRPMMNKVLPACRKYHLIMFRGRKLIDELAEKRRQQYRELEATGQALPKTGDNIVWMDDLAKGNSYDLAGASLFMSLAANPTATDVITNAIYELAAHPEYVEPLREEIKASLSGVWDKTFLDSLKKMDSFLREVLRLNPLSIVAMQRKATADITFKDGSVLPKGAATCVSMEVMTDPQYYPNPHQFDGYRFLNSEEQGVKEGDKTHFISPESSYLAFGYGKHQCPGRFFADYEIKTLLAHLLMLYDWRFPDGSLQKPQTVTQMVINKKDSSARICYRWRDDADEQMAAMP